MALTQRLEIRQSHSLVMTPQLMQAIKLLQLSNLDLAAYVENELEGNPLLERAAESDEDRRAAEREANGAKDPPPAEWSDGNGADHAAPGDERDGPHLDAGDDDDARRGSTEPAPGYSEWAGVGSGRQEDSEYN